jgi:hypothetical protein
MSNYVEFRKAKPLWVSSNEERPLAEFSSLIGPREWLFINAEVSAISVQDARALRDWLNKALPKEESK